MSYRSHRAHRDRNHVPIVRALEAAGCVVVDLSSVGGGCPDLLVYRRATGLLRLVEIKNPETTLRKDGTPYASQKETVRRQAEFARRVPVWRALTVEEALGVMGIEVSRCA